MTLKYKNLPADWLYLNMPNKAAFREIYRAKRKELSLKDLELASNDILKHVLAQNLVAEGPLMLFLDSPAHGELPMQNWFECFANHQICVPKVIDDKGRMEAVAWKMDMPLKANKWGILEPETNVFVSPKNIITIIVPLLCFDQRGHRVGYGKGYYDRFLARCSNSIKTIGISAFGAVENIEDITAQDQILDVVVTPKKVYLL